VVCLPRPVAASGALPTSIHPKQISPANGFPLDRLRRARPIAPWALISTPAFRRDINF
jgi:hypothetical protein